MIKQIDYKVAVDFLLPRHYSGRKPNIVFAFGEYDGDSLVAVCTFGIPASPMLCKGIAGEKYRKNVLELNRLCREPDYPFILSHFVAGCLKRLDKHNWIIVSYSDMAMNHHGYIYQACNFLYTGSTKPRTDKYVRGGRHPRHYDNAEQGEYRLLRSAKHRYVYILGNKRFKKAVLNDFKYPIYDSYPTGDNSNYVLGEYLKPVLLKKGNSKGYG